MDPSHGPDIGCVSDSVCVVGVMRLDDPQWTPLMDQTVDVSVTQCVCCRCDEIR